MTRQATLGAMRRTLLAALSAALLVVLAPATATAATAPDRQPSSVRVGHLVPGLGPVSITATSFAGGEPVVLAASASYGAVAQHQDLPAGTYSVAASPTGSTAPRAPALTGIVTTEPGASVTVLALGTAAAPRLQAVPDDLAAPERGAAKVRVINASSLAAVASVTVQGGPALAIAARFSEPGAYTAVAAGPLPVQATSGSAQGTTTLDAAPNSVYTLLLLNDDRGGLELRSVLDAAGAGAVPAGGAATGGGGTAGADAPALAVGAALVGAAVAGLGALVVLVLRSTPPASGGRRRAVAGTGA